MKDRIVLGIDPGASGALAFYWPDHLGRVAVEDAPAVDGVVSAAAVARLIEKYGATEAVIETVGAMPGQGVSSMFRFGFSTGAVHGVLGALNIPYVQVTPTRWKKRMGLPADKEAARGMAIRTFPHVADRFSRKKDHGRAEAALLAYYAAHVMNERNAA